MFRIEVANTVVQSLKHFRQDCPIMAMDYKILTMDCTIIAVDCKIITVDENIIVVVKQIPEVRSVDKTIIAMDNYIRYW